MENGAQLQANKALALFGVALSNPGAVLGGARSQSRMLSDDKATAPETLLTVNSHFSPGAGWRYDFPARFLEAIEGWWLRRRLRAQLYALSDDMLKDIGISRWEIDWIVNSPQQDPTKPIDSARPQFSAPEFLQRV